MNSTRVARNLSAAVVAAIAAWSSYQHMVHVALGVGERPDVAYVLPLSVDGMLVVASVAMVDDRRSGRKVRWSARVAFVAGVTASVAANVAGAHPTIGARIVAAWPAVALLLTVELLSRAGRPAKAERAPAASPEASQVEAPAEVAEVPPAVTGSRRRPAAKTTRRPAEKTRAMATALMEAEPGITRAEVARRLKVTPRRLRDVLNEAAGIAQESAESGPARGYSAVSTPGGQPAGGVHTMDTPGQHNGQRVELAEAVSS